MSDNRDDVGEVKVPNIEDIYKLRGSIASALETVRQEYRKLQGLLRQVESDKLQPNRDWITSFDTPKFRTRAERTPQPRWQSVFQLIHYSDNASFGYEEVMAACKMHGFVIKKSSLRPKIFFYIDRGYIERISAGKFRISRSGLNYFGIYSS